MKCNHWISTASVFLILLFCATAHAQKTYRCGSAYQDRPCDDAQSSKEVRYLGGTTAAPAQKSMDQQCKQRGLDSQKIVWARQSGVLADKLIAEVAAKGLDSNKASDEKDLIFAVYQKQRGSAIEVAAAIEADCIEAKKQAELAAAMVAAGMKLQGKDPSAAGTQASTSSTGVQGASKAQGESAPSGKVAASNTALCGTLAARIDAIKSRQRTGGSVTEMENLNRQRTDAESERSRAGC